MTPHSRRALEDPAREELAHALRSSIPAMGNRIAAARALAQCPQLVDLVTSGAISAWAARLVTDHLTDLDHADSSLVVADVADRVRRRLGCGRRPYHSAEVNRLARAARLRIVPEQDRAARVRAHAGRRVCVYSRGDGMASVVADLAEVDAFRIHRRLTAIAAGLQADSVSTGTREPGTRDQLRADVLVDLLLGSPTGSTGQPRSAQPDGYLEVPPPPDASGTEKEPPPIRGDGARPGLVPPRPDIQVVVSLEALLGLAQQPALLPGVGPIPADVARELAADGRWRALLTDASGAITAVGARTYTPSAAVARLVRAREPHCRFPGCRQPAVTCDLDHTVPWPIGSTTPENLGPLCRRHHQLKTHGGWALDPIADTSPDTDEGRHEGPGRGQDAGSGMGSGVGSGPGGEDSGGRRAARGWRWTSPAGLTACESPDPPLP